MIPVAIVEDSATVHRHDYSSSESEIGCLRHNLHQYNNYDTYPAIGTDSSTN